MAEKATYTHGHHASVLRSHGQRTALNSARFLLTHLQPHMKILDIGCGPGTITVDLATYVPQGHVTGLEMAGDILPAARQLAASRGLTNIDFVAGDANALPYADESFDVVFCHQVLQHVADPTAILAEMRRVCKIGGIVAAREADYAAFMWYPELPGLKRWQELYDRVARRNGGEPNAGRYLHVWARRAGFEEVDCAVSSWCFARPEEVSWWSETWRERAVKSAFAKGALEHGFATERELESISDVWKEWGEDRDAWISIPSAEVVCRRV
ncbi:class I SAM-dependent methyltransferase [Aspergillus homomorphus CBS 101889]|uniref:UbiE/COQ5 methyltransferase n=1 Tax=Aspergillus homomorphus (strain CBS 101889) TaxID=1450537 RepID=A0A395HL88_ASPHC|nr:UbiE/COQ5 methyltransferase [Aspergillus homomorphus CBS 101889]RAL08530.1 UbiE/COQ5 methyltransferase [Aspergillus homomorphus CBS 101889]